MTSQREISYTADLQEAQEAIEGYMGPAEVAGQVQDSPATPFVPSPTITLYRMDTGEPAEILAALARYTLGLKDPDGSPIFSQDPVSVTIQQGTIKCRLHEDDKQRETWDGMGLPFCTKDNLHNAYEVESHMKRTHVDAREAIYKWETDVEKTEWRQQWAEQQQWQRDSFSAMKDIAIGGRPVPGHVHKYELKEAGSPCLVEGCTHVRPEPTPAPKE